MMVCDLIVDFRCWNVPFLRSLFWDEDVESICPIPKCQIVRLDSWVCHYTYIGIFSIKSSYMLLINSNQPSSSYVNGSLKWWKTLRVVQISNKVKLMMWKLFHNILSSNANLY